MPQAVPRTEPERGLQPIMPGVSGAVDAEISAQTAPAGCPARSMQKSPADRAAAEGKTPPARPAAGGESRSVQVQLLFHDISRQEIGNDGADQRACH